MEACDAKVDVQLTDIKFEHAKSKCITIWNHQYKYYFDGFKNADIIEAADKAYS